MPAKIIDGKIIAEQVRQENAAAVAELKKRGITPGLAVVLVGDDPASHVYVDRKAKACAELGLYSQKIELPADTSMEKLLDVIDQLNRDPRIHGILVQSPPPPQIDEAGVVAAIHPGKDVDCFHAVNVGKMLLGDCGGFLPCTPHGILVLLEKSGIDPAGKHVVILGRSNIVGKPLMALFVQKARGANATVTCVHSATRNPAELTRQADILIAAVGKPEFVTADMVKPGAVVVDVGINRVADASAKRGYRLVGDVAYDEVAAKASAITPVPGGVGPMTIAMLMRNAIQAAQKA